MKNKETGESETHIRGSLQALEGSGQDLDIARREIGLGDHCGLFLDVAALF